MTTLCVFIAESSMQSLADNPSQGIYVGGFPRKLRERLKKRA
jgi:hypothetical protein